MSDWLIVRIPFDDPEKVEVVKQLSNVPLNWKDYLEKIAKRTKKPGRYVVTNILYQEGEAFFPQNKKVEYQKTEKESGD